METILGIMLVVVLLASLVDSGTDGDRQRAPPRRQHRNASWSSDRDYDDYRGRGRTDYRDYGYDTSIAGTIASVTRVILLALGGVVLLALVLAWV